MRAFAVLACLAALLSAAPARATLALARSLEEMARIADVVAIAHVESSDAAWRGKRIYTLARLTPTRLLKGKAEGELLVEVEGGVVGAIGQQVAGAPRFTPGEDVAVFLHRVPDTDPPVYRVVGMSQGKLRVEPRPDGVKVVRDLGQLDLVMPNPAGELRPAPTGPDAQPIDDFVRDVSAAAGRSTGTP
jgi:hypothetical protein